MPRLRVAAAQIECKAGDVSANLERHRRALREATTHGADIVVFPELSLTDYQREPDVAGLGMALSAPQFIELARDCAGITAIVGFIEKADGEFYNSGAALRDGRVIHVHRKINVPEYGNLCEGRYFAHGKDIGLHTFADWRIATLICADTWNPAVPWLAALKGAELLLVPVASALDAITDFDNPAGWDINLRHTAMTFGLPTVMCNHCGSRGGLRFWGGSRILDQHGDTLALCGGAPQMIVADIDSAAVAATRDRLPTVRDAAPELIAEALQTILRDRNDVET
jgi:predicted amidohydrolase